MRRSQPGICSLPTVLLALTLSAVPLLLLGQISQRTRQVHETSRHFGALTTLQQYLESINDAFAATGVRVYPRVHRAGEISLSDKGLLHVSRTPALLPDGIGDAISWAETDAARMLKVVSSDTRGYGISFQSCFALRTSHSLPQDVQSFLAVTRDGVFELVESQRHYAGRSTCLELNLTADESVLVDSPDTFYPKGTLLLIPLMRINTIYRDVTGTLRLLSHRGRQIEQNQPVLEKLPIFRISQVLDPFGHQILSLTIQSPHSSIKPALLSVPLTAASPLSLTIGAALG